MLKEGEKDQIPVEISTLTNNLKDFLLSSEAGNSIAKVVLFGSYAKRQATADSDIDILVLTTENGDIEKVIMEKIYDFILEYDVPLEVLIANIDSLYLHKDYFTCNVFRYGQEIYSMEKNEIKASMLMKLKDLAEEYLDSAEEVLENQRIRLAVDAGYNAAELAAKGLILCKQDDLPGSHGGIISTFGQLYVKTEEASKSIGRDLNRALQLRNLARYKPDALLQKADAEGVMKLARGLIALLSDKIEALR
ncbi:MAG: HEPN domain-containing protein [Deltaproteobacteria bacterium]|nr:HEPN domain-containing protein [Deltaproteobacteria bacterium]